MKIVNATTGKIGSYFVGPKCYLHENIRLGEIVVCIGREEQRAAKPYIWIIGGIEQLIDYVSLVRSKGEIEEAVSSLILSRLDEAKKKIPQSAIERLASATGMEVDELKEIMSIAQVAVSAPVEGVQDFSDAKPKWLPKTQSHASIH